MESIFRQHGVYRSGEVAVGTGVWMRRSTAIIAMVLLAVFVGVGCFPVSAPSIKRDIPEPVHDRDMTLYWSREVKQAALSLIEHAKRRCYLDIYELSDGAIIDALEQAKQRGVDVRVVVDATERHSQSVGLPELSQRGVPVRSLAIHRGISHIKMLISDDSVLMGGMNFGAMSWSNNDASVYLPNANESFAALFRWDWARAANLPAAEPARFLPLVSDSDIGREAVEAIDSAKQSVEMEAFDLSDYHVIAALESAVARGVTVEVLLDSTQYPNRKSSGELRDAGATVRFYHPYRGELMHAKILDVDAGRIFLIGSANFSHQAYSYNHEGDLLLSDVPRFDQSLETDLAVQVSRGTDYPLPRKSHGDSGE